MMGKIIRWLRGFPQKRRATGYCHWGEHRLCYSSRRLPCCPLQAEHSCRHRWRVRDAVFSRDVGECWGAHTALGPQGHVPVPSHPEVKAGHVWKGRSLWGFKAAISPQWKAGSVSVVRAEEKKARVGTSLC